MAHLRRIQDEARADAVGTGRSRDPATVRNSRMRWMAAAAAIACLAVGVWVGRDVLPIAGRPAAQSSSPAATLNAAQMVEAAYIADPRFRQQRAALVASLQSRLEKLPPESREKVVQSLATIHKSMQDLQSALVHRAAVHQVSGTAYAPGAVAALVQPSGPKPGYLIVQGLPASPKGKVYQLWLIRGTTPYSAAVFSYSGGSPKVVKLTRASSGYSVTAATVEPGPDGSPGGPTGRQVLVGKLRA